jgi:hypothetical protein
MRRFFCGESEYQSLALNGNEISLWRRIIFGYLFLPVLLTGLIVVCLLPEIQKFLIDQMGSIVVVIIALTIIFFLTTIILFRMSLHFLFFKPEENFL